MNSYKFKDNTTQNKPIIISKNLLTDYEQTLQKINNNSPTYSYEYSLNNIFFDPCQSSPPNEFMQKLEKRFYNYNTSGTK